jgi:hypothetical protein
LQRRAVDLNTGRINRDPTVGIWKWSPTQASTWKPSPAVA